MVTVESQINAAAFNWDRISLLVEFLLKLEIKIYLLNNTYTATSAAFGTAIPNVSCMYLSVASLLKFL